MRRGQGGLIDPEMQALHLILQVLQHLVERLVCVIDGHRRAVRPCLLANFDRRDSPPGQIGSSMLSRSWCNSCGVTGRQTRIFPGALIVQNGLVSCSCSTSYSGPCRAGIRRNADYARRRRFQDERLVLDIRQHPVSFSFACGFAASAQTVADQPACRHPVCVGSLTVCARGFFAACWSDSVQRLHFRPTQASPKSKFLVLLKLLKTANSSPLWTDWPAATSSLSSLPE